MEEWGNFSAHPVDSAPVDQTIHRNRSGGGVGGDEAMLDRLPKSFLHARRLQGMRLLPVP